MDTPKFTGLSWSDNERANVHTSNSSVDLCSSDESIHRIINFTTDSPVSKKRVTPKSTGLSWSDNESGRNRASRFSLPISSPEDSAEEIIGPTMNFTIKNTRANVHTSNSSVDLCSSGDSMHHPINFTTESPIWKTSGLKLRSARLRVPKIPHCMICKTHTIEITNHCGHTFCRKCISEQKCFKCQKEEFSSTRPDHFFAELGDVVCDYCLETKYKAVKYCFECTVHLCENHVRCHIITPAHQGHTLTEVDGNPKQMLCPQHNRTLEVFCKTDQMHICKVCAGEKHKGHDKVYRIMSEPASLCIGTLLGRMSADELRTFIQELTDDYPDCLGSQLEDLDASEVVIKLLKSFGENGALIITQRYQKRDTPKSTGLSWSDNESGRKLRPAEIPHRMICKKW